ncbi:spore germination protein GerPB [Xylanibacillus composti]|uniref:Uncharacterized protein n=1 Tax=Xylanibacillus composti TaxID=1572762 RepID=A0A8J4M1G4_9BACL|nr:spore germination protein GerPB [Xylanibacillus composti]GIQ67822.1 hypothetical protein XYCOK13_06460 [Xylanibacillus composti]
MGNVVIHQNITIHHLRVEGISNSSILQIGSAGSIRALANLYNTGRFTEAAPLLGLPEEEASLVPFAQETR